MSSEKSHFVDVLKYWRSIETFTLPALPDERDKVINDLKPPDLLPWEHEDFHHPSEKKR